MLRLLIVVIVVNVCMWNDKYEFLFCIYVMDLLGMMIIITEEWAEDRNRSRNI